MVTEILFHVIDPKEIGSKRRYSVFGLQQKNTNSLKLM